MPIESTRELSTYTETFHAWRKHASPRLLALLVLVTVMLRIVTAGYHWLDMAALLAGVALWPMLEWFLHRHLLHLKPVHVFGLTIDPDFCRKHRAHHRSPFKPELIVFPAYVPIIFAPLLLGSAWFLAPDRGLALSALLGFSLAALNYEWTHFLVHTAVNPQSHYYQALFRNHRLHHFRNERYWFGFTLTSVDSLLGTAPDPQDTPRSPHCRDLGVPETGAAG